MVTVTNLNSSNSGDYGLCVIDDGPGLYVAGRGDAAMTVEGSTFSENVDVGVWAQLVDSSTLSVRRSTRADQESFGLFVEMKDGAVKVVEIVTSTVTANSSPLIGAGEPGFAALATDQRGEEHVSGGRLDIGAVEVQMLTTTGASAQGGIPAVVA